MTECARESNTVRFSSCSSAAFFSVSSSPLVSSVCLMSKTAAMVATAFRLAFRMNTVRKPRMYAPRIVWAVSGERPSEVSVDEEAEVRAPRIVGSSTIVEIVDEGRPRVDIVWRRELFLKKYQSGSIVYEDENGRGRAYMMVAPMARENVPPRSRMNCVHRIVVQ